MMEISRFQRHQNEKSQNFRIPGCREELSWSQVTMQKNCKFQEQGEQRSNNRDFEVSQAQKRKFPKFLDSRLRSRNFGVP